MTPLKMELEDLENKFSKEVSIYYSENRDWSLSNMRTKICFV